MKRWWVEFLWSIFLNLSFLVTKLQFRNQKQLGLWLVVALLSLTLLLSTLFQIKSSSTPASLSAGHGIIFVTPTAQSSLSLSPQAQPLLPPPEPPQTFGPNPTPAPYFTEANEMGQLLILEYHKIGYPEQRYQRTPDNFRADLQRLYQTGYYPVNFIDVIQGLPALPPGKKPVVLTFDDSDRSQFHVLANNTIDADSAVGILLNFHNQYPEAWPLRATFFVLGNDNLDYHSIFGQPEWAKAKIQTLVDLGMEVGSHTVSHADLSVVTAERLYWELAISQHVIEQLAPGYTVQSLSVPFGGFPYTLEFLKAGRWGNYSYTYAGNAAAWGGPSVSPFDSTFEPYKVSRLEVTATSIDYWLTYFEQNAYDYYVSDGDPARITFPQPKAALGE